MAKRQKKPDPIPPPSDPGAALFLELMMQMLAFFILLTSIAVIVEERRLAAIGSLAGTFSPLPKGANLTEGKGPSMPARDIVEGTRAPKRTAKELTDVARELGLGSAIHVLPLDQDKVRVRFPENIIFSQGHVDITRNMYPLMDRLALIFQKPEVIEVRIEGHTDDTPVRGSLFPSNWELSAARAMSFFHAMAQRGVAKGRMVAAGMGDQHPIQQQPDLSRRVEIVLKFRPVTIHESSIETGSTLGPPQLPAVAPPMKSF
ncbi:MAG: OmpA family protein [Mariprofundaceae bacterium]|nr:OmpA family protein [Mariprofundaceae bacterium]